MTKYLLIPGLFILILISCKPKVAVTETIITPVKTDTILQPSSGSETMYSPDVLYVIAREYEAIYDTSTVKFDTPKAKQIREKYLSPVEYIEARLIELYPHKAYKGLLDDISVPIMPNISFGEQEIVLPDNEISFVTSDADNEAFHFFISAEDEMNFMQMTTREREKYKQLNKLATSEDFAVTSDFNEIAQKDSIFQLLNDEDKAMLLEENVLLSCMLLANGGAYLIYRVNLSKERAMYDAQKYYQDNTSCGKKGDAFKHLFVNMMLRRYLSENMAFMVMDVFWENAKVNSPCDKHMDLHNNYVGRHTQYKNFRGSLFNNDWKKWSNTIHEFVEQEDNSIEKNWNKRIMEYNIVKDKEGTDQTKYIFWNRTTECEY